MRVGWCGGGQPVGETQQRPFQLSFNSSLRVDFQGARVTSDGGLLVVRELDERLRLSELVDRHLSDSRRGKNIQLPLAELLRQSIYSRLAGYEDVNDAGRLSQDPTFRLIGSHKICERGAALTSRLQSFETEVLTQEENLAGLAALNRELVATADAIDSPRRVVLDMDSTEIPVYGEQVEKAHVPDRRFVAGPSHWPGQQLDNVPLQVVVERKANGVLHVPLFQRLVEFRLGEGHVGAEDYLLALPLLALNLGQQQLFPARGAVDVAGPQLGGEAVTLAIE
jgi:Transposase DDE domain group 1